MDSGSDIYRKLQKHIDNMPVAFPESESGLDIRLLKHLFTPEEAEIVLELSALPEPLERIYRRLRHTGISIEDLEAALDRLVDRGNIIGGKFYETKGRGKYYSKAQLVIGMYEFQGTNLTREFEKDFNEYMNETFHKVAFTKKTSQMRTIPINKGFTPERYVGAYDNLREWIQSTNRPIAVTKCICRHGKDLLEDPCKHSDIRETCISFEDAANWVIDAGKARAITKEETLEILERAENAGMVLQPENNQQPQFVCCCCGCCCHVLRSLRKYPRPVEYYHSNYFAQVDPAICEMCRECIGKCPMEARAMKDEGINVDLDRCIGCGACHVACPSGAIALEAKDKIYIPPKHHDAMYQKILVERIGLPGMLKVIPKMILKRKI